MMSFVSTNANQDRILTCDSLDGITVYVGSLRLNGGNLTLCLGTLLQLRHLLPLNGRRGNLLTKDDVSDLAGSERSNVDTVTLSEILWANIRYEGIERYLTKLTARIRSFNATSTLIHSSSDKDGQTKCGSVIVFLSGRRMILAFSLLTCRPRRSRMRRENAV